MIHSRVRQTGNKLIVISGLIAVGAFLAPLSASASTNEIAFLSYTDGYWQVWTMDAKGNKTHQVTKTAYDKSRISWFPDGKHVLVMGSQGTIVRVDIGSGKETPIKLSLTNVFDAVVSPNGKWIAASINTAGGVDNNDIWVAKADGSQLKRLARIKGLQHDPAWSQNNHWIYFHSGEGGQNHDIWRMSRDGKRKEQITVGQIYNFDVAVGEKGHIAFSSNRSGNYELYIKNKKRKARQLTHDPALDGRPSWSPNAKFIVFESTRNGGVPNIWKLSTRGGKPEQLTKRKQGARAPVWRWAGGK